MPTVVHYILNLHLIRFLSRQIRQEAQLILYPKNPPTWWNRCLTHLCSAKKKAKRQVDSPQGKWWTPGWLRGGAGLYGQ